MKKNLLVLLLLVGASVFAQRTCHTDAKMAALMADPAFAGHHQQVMSRIANDAQLRQSDTEQPTVVVTVPVVFHILWKNTTQNISDAQINSQLAILNQDFRKQNTDFNTVVPAVFQSFGADLEIVFVKATVAPDGTPTTGITRKQVPLGFVFEDNYYLPAGEPAWDPIHYMNVWVGRFTDSSLLGFAYLPSAAGAAFDGLCIGDQYFGNTGTATAPFNKGRTATHEIGHYFGLNHPWAAGCAGNDGVADTPATTGPYFGCPSFPNNSNACSTSPNGSMFMNYMDYVDDACMAFFTNGQKAIVQSTINNERADLILANSNVQNIYPISIHPNPAADYFMITSSQVNIDRVEIYNVNGQLVKNQKMNSLEDKISVSEFETGVYYLRLYNGSQFLKTEKIIKQ